MRPLQPIVFEYSDTEDTEDPHSSEDIPMFLPVMTLNDIPSESSSDPSSYHSSEEIPMFGPPSPVLSVLTPMPDLPDLPNITWQRTPEDIALELMPELMDMVKRGDIPGVKLLIEQGASVNSIENDNKTPLYYAIEWSRDDMIEFLLENGANPFIKVPINHTNVYPSSLCRRYQNTKCYNIIRKYMWRSVLKTDKRLAQQYSRSGDFQLPPDVWELILLRKRQQRACSMLGTDAAEEIVSLAVYLDIPINTGMDKKTICYLVSEQLVWGGKYTEKAEAYRKVRSENTRKQILTIAFKLGIDIKQDVNKILDELGMFIQK